MRDEEGMTPGRIAEPNCLSLNMALVCQVQVLGYVHGGIYTGRWLSLMQLLHQVEEHSAAPHFTHVMAAENCEGRDKRRSD